MTAVNAMFERLSGAQGGEDREAEGLSAAAKAQEPGNFLRHFAALSMTKSADGLFDPKLVLSWLLSHLGTPAALIGLLVPIREAGALLPQLFTAPHIHALPVRKWAWALACLGQGVAALLLVLIGLNMQGATAGVAACGAVALLAVSRSVASVSYKDILGKTIAKTRRGAVTGSAASASALVVVIFALLLIFAPMDRFILVIGALGMAAVLWGAAFLTFSTLREDRDPGAGDPRILSQLRLLRDKPMLRRFIYARGLLTGTALAPPYLIVLGAQAGNGTFKALGASVLASAVASFLSSYVWGRLADRSSKTVLMLSGLFGAAALVLGVVLDLMGLSSTLWAIPVSLFLLMICYHGVRKGRSTYLVDLAPSDQRTAYTAVANTVIGVILLGSGAIGAVASLIGPHGALLCFAGLALAGAGVASRLSEVETGFSLFSMERD